MPDAPTWGLREMTFQRFFDACLQKNRIDKTKEFIPWGLVMSTFEGYVRKHWPNERDDNIRKHVSSALKYTKMRDRIPASLLDKHERRLNNEGLERLSEGAGRPAASAQQHPVHALPTELSLNPGAGSARLGVDAAGDSRKRAYAGRDGSPASPKPKHLKIEVRLVTAPTHRELMFDAASLS